MRAKILECDDSLAIRLPRAVLDLCGLLEGDELEIAAVDDEGMTFKRVIPRYEPEALFTRILLGNRHKEVDWGAYAEGEVW